MYTARADVRGRVAATPRRRRGDYVETSARLRYVLNPVYCHRLVGYVEEEACSTYTKIIGGINHAPEGSELAAWRTQQAPAIGRAYWHLGEEGTVLDLMLAIRADEANHRDVNHLAAGMKPGQINPFFDPGAKLDKMLLKYVKDVLNTSGGAPPKTAAA